MSLRIFLLYQQFTGFFPHFTTGTPLKNVENVENLVNN